MATKRMTGDGDDAHSVNRCRHSVFWREGGEILRAVKAMARHAKGLSPETAIWDV
jgi:hypothetical protein